MNEQKTITITVPFTMRETPFDFDDFGSWRKGDERWLGVNRGKHEIRIAERDIGRALLAAWPAEPTTDRAKRLAEIEAAIASAPRGVWSWEPHGNGWALYIDRGEPIDRDAPRGFCNAQHGWNIGVAADGRPLAERIGELHHWYDALHRAAVNIVCDRGDKGRWSGLSRMGEAITRIAAEDSAALIVLRGLALATWVNSGAERERFLLLLGGALFDQGLMWDRASFPNGDPSPAGEKLLAAVYKAHGAPEEDEPQAGGLGLTPEQTAARYPDALAGLSPEQRAHLTALADPARRARFNGSTARIAVRPVTSADTNGNAIPPSGRGAKVRAFCEVWGVRTEDLATALGLDVATLRGVLFGRAKTDDAGWLEITTAMFALAGGLKPEHIADPASSPAFQRAMEREEDDAPEEAAPAGHSPEAMWRDLAAPTPVGYVPEAGCDDCGNDPGQLHAVTCSRSAEGLKRRAGR